MSIFVNRNAVAIRFIAPKSKFYSDEIYGNYCEKYHTNFQIEFCYPTFSIANLKSLLYDAYIMNRFFVISGFRPNVAEIERKAKLA